MKSDLKLDRDEAANGASPKMYNVEAGRRGFIQSLGLGAAGAAVLGATFGGAKPAHADAATDVAILTFALNLEYLESEFYLRAITGQGLSASDTSGTGTPGPVVGGRLVPFTTRAIANYALEIALDERAHVRFLRSALTNATGSVIARPAIDLTYSFTIAARRGGIIGPNDTFDAFASEQNFLLAAFIFEDVGVTAYHGAAPSLSTAYIPAASGILATEAYHAGILRTVLYSRGLFVPASQISGARDYYDGAGDDDQNIGDANTANLVPTDENGIVYSRTPDQVKNIVYLNTNGTKGGFFPYGLNGSIT